MKKLKHNFKKGMAFVLSLAMVAGLVPAMSGGADTVQAAANLGTEPSVSAYATKEQLMTAFTPDSYGYATTIGKLVFGKKSDGTTAQKWYILGKDRGVLGDNTIIFAASPIATNQVFENDYENNKAFQSSFGVYESNPSVVYPNHYGASDLRVALQGMASNPNYFTTAEQGLMNATTVTTQDTRNKDSSDNYLTYTTTDKLYALAADGSGSSYNTIKAGTSDSTVLAMNSYWSSGAYFWLRSPEVSYGSGAFALLAHTHDYVNYGGVYGGYAVQPASNLNLSSVLFASAATAASSDTVSDTIASETAMTLRFDGTGKNIGTVTYNTTTGDIKAAKGSTSQTVALVVQGKEGTNDWYYSKQITGTDVVNVTDIVSETNTPASINLSTCKIWLEITDTDELIYAVGATEEVLSITSVEITGIDTPVSNTALDTEASCATTGVSSTTPQITWTPSDSTAGYNTRYTASITLTAGTGYEYADTVTATVLGNSATSVTKNADGTLTVTYNFPATAKDKLTSITAPQAITVANGTAYSAMNLPATVNIVTEGNTVTSAPVTWNTTTPENGSYDPAVLTQQTVTLNGTVVCPDSIDANGVSLTTTITITISAAGIVGAPTANPTAGTYTENQSLTLTSSTEGATIYYTTDGSEPTITGGVPGGTTAEYTAPIAVTGTEGQSITTTIKAIAVKNGMQDSSVETFTYTIQIPVPKYTVTVTNGSGTGQYAQGEMVTITAGAAPGGQQFKEWEVVSGTITLASSTSATTTFTMPAEAVSVKANYEAGGSSGGNFGGGSYIPPIQQQPQIKDDKENTGWTAIEKKIEEAIKSQTEGGTKKPVTIDMNGTTTVPKAVLDTVKGKDVNIVFEMGKGISWTINGKDVTNVIGDMKFGVKTNTSAIPVDIINKVTGERVNMQIHLEHEGTFGFAATLTLNVEAKHKGMYANLFYYNPKAQAGSEMKFICAGEIDENGNADLLFNHASDYTIVIDKEPMQAEEKGETPAEPEKPTTPETSVPKKGTLLTDSRTKMVYKVTKSDKENGTLQFVKTKDKRAKKIAVPSTVTLDGITYKVTSVAANALKNNHTVTTLTIGSNVKTIGKHAFYGCKNVKSITIKTTKLTSKNVGSSAFKGIDKKAAIKVPKSKYTSYRKLLKNKGVSSKVKIK